MKKILLFVVVLALLQVSSASSQTLNDYVSAIKGDTLVIKTQDEMSGAANALYSVIKMDTLNVPAGRVYMLKANGVYPLQNNPTGYANRTLRIIGSDPTMLVANKNDQSMLPVVCGNVGTSVNQASINSSGNLLVKNCALAPASNDGSPGWAFSNTTNPSGGTYEWNNCLFEHTRWILQQVSNNGMNIKFKNCYFVNLSGQPCRRNGGVYDGFNPLDTFLVENSTHVNTQGLIYKWRNYTAKRIIINHNTFVDGSASAFLDLGTQVAASYTYNLFVNVNVQPLSSGFILDNGEVDLDVKAMGLVNVYPDSTLEAKGTPRKFLVEGNWTYWDPYLANIADTANIMKINGRTTWFSQMVRMNDRTKAMFDNNTKYPYLVEGAWFDGRPAFKNPGSLMSATLVALKAFSLNTIDTASKATLPDWRVTSKGAGTYVYADFPIPVDLSYTNAQQLTAANGGFPIGDLNWFPTQKAQWLAQSTAEYTKIQAALDAGKTVSTVKNSPSAPNSFELSQNYPNPFNPSTQITYTLSKSGLTTLKVFNVLGQEVATLVNGVETAGTHVVNFNASKLSSGVYFYTLTAGNTVESKKMTLMK